MARAPLQVLVLPFRYTAGGSIAYAIFRRHDHADACWQGVAGGAEQGESAAEAARREMMEEAGIPSAAPLLPLDTKTSVPAAEFHERDLWGSGHYVVTEHAFGVLLEDGQAITLSSEHTEYRWLPYEEALELLRWDSNRTALWELNERLRRRHGVARHLRLTNPDGSLPSSQQTQADMATAKLPRRSCE